MATKKVPARTKRAIQPQAPVLLPRYAQWEWVYTPSAGINNLGSTKIAGEFVGGVTGYGGSTKAGKAYALGNTNVGALRLGDASCKFTQTKPVSGLIVFRPTVNVSDTALFIASAANAGLYVKVSTSNSIEIDTAGSALLLSGSTNEVVINDINVVAFCIEPRVADGGSGRISYAINGKLVTSTWTATPAFNNQSHFGTGQSSENNIHQQMLSCASTASISNAELVALSNDPWQIFQPSPAKSSLWLNATAAPSGPAFQADAFQNDAFQTAAAGIVGTLASTDGADVLAASGILTNTGTSTTTDGADVLSASGVLTNTGTSATTDGADVLAASGAVSNVGTIAVTDGADVLAASGILTNTGTSTTTDGADVLSAAGVLTNTGTSATTDGADVLNASGTASLNVTGTLATTDGADVLAANAVLTNTGTSATTDGADVLIASGTASLAVTGTIATTDGADVLAASGSLILAGTLNTTDGADVLSAAGVLTNTGSIATTDGADTPAFNGAISVSGTISTTDGADTPSFSGAVSVNGTIATTDGADTPSFTGNLSNAGSLAYLNGADALSMSGSVSAIVVTGTLNFVEGSGVNLDGLILYDIEYGRFVKVLNNYLVVTLQ